MIDPVEYQVIVNHLSGIAREMQQALFRTGYSTIIRESQDASCAVLTADGRVIGQHVVLPLHMGSFPVCAEAVLRYYPVEKIEDGDAFILNSPYEGGSPHANDLAVLTPVFYEGELVAFCANIAHKSDIGGSVPGSGPGDSTDVFQEGLQLPPVRYMSRHGVVAELDRVLTANSRTPTLVRGDVGGQVGAARLGERRVTALIERYGLGTVIEACEELFARTERSLRHHLSLWPDGTYEAEGWLDTDGVTPDRRVRLHVRAVKRGDGITFDFSGSDPATRGPANIRPQLVHAACYYALIALTDPDLAPNHGLARAIEVITTPGTVLNPVYPAPVGNYIMTAQLVVDIVLSALGRAVPERAIAGSGGDGSLGIGWGNAQERVVQYEILGSAYGASCAQDGASGVDPHVANCRATPIEILESEFPVRVRRFELIPDSGGAGRHRGGLGYVREYEVLDETGALSVKSDKQQVPAWGLAGGLAGRPGSIVLNPGRGDERRLAPRLSNVKLGPGDILRFERPGGGGYGPPAERPRDAVLADVRDGYVSPVQAVEVYGMEPGSLGGLE